MTEKEFNLSECRHKCPFCKESPIVIEEKDIKEFIKRLKEKFKKGEENIYIDVPHVCLDYSKVIDKLAGEKLTK